MDTTSPAVTLDIDEGVACLTLNRPARRNAMDRALIDELRQSLLQADRDDAVHAILLAGAGKGFCAGSDLKYIGALGIEDMARFEQDTGDVGRLMGLISKPIVAAVETFAIGGGFILAACCDVVVAGRASRWSLPEVPHGWLTPWGLNALVQRVGRVRARNLCFCLETLDGAQAVAIGLADQLADDGQAHAHALALARRLAQLPPAAVVATKRFFAGGIMRDAEIMDVQANLLFAENCRHAQARQTLDQYR